jgi:hypothetical protein
MIAWLKSIKLYEYILLVSSVLLGAAVYTFIWVPGPNLGYRFIMFSMFTLNLSLIVFLIGRKP